MKEFVNTQFILRCLQGEGKAREIYDDLSQVLVVPDYLPFKDEVETSQKVAGVPALRRYLQSWDDSMLDSKDTVFGELKIKGDVLSFSLFNHDMEHDSLIQELSDFFISDFAVKEKPVLFHDSYEEFLDERNYAVLPDLDRKARNRSLRKIKGVPESWCLPIPSESETRHILSSVCSCFASLPEGKELSRNEHVGSAVEFVSRQFPARKEYAEDWGSITSANVGYNPFLDPLDMKELASKVARQVCRPGHSGLSVAEVLSMINGSSAAQLDSFTRDVMWKVLLVKPSFESGQMISELKKWTDVHPSDDYLERREVESIVDGQYRAMHKPDRGAWYVDPVGSLRRCEEDSLDEFFKRTGQAPGNYVKISDTDALELRLSSLVNRFGENDRLPFPVKGELSGMEIDSVVLGNGRPYLVLKGKHEPCSLDVYDLNMKETKALDGLVDDSFDALAYASCCKGMRAEQKELEEVEKNISSVLGPRNGKGERRGVNWSDERFNGSSVLGFVARPSDILDIKGNRIDFYSIVFDDGNEKQLLDMTPLERRQAGLIASRTKFNLDKKESGPQLQDKRRKGLKI